ncbi:MAG: twin-arginine translocase TatA/TatE family subunit [Kofleriaceae bacterium]
MFGIGGTEVLVILVVAMLFLGPDKLPEAAKSISKGIRDLRKQTREFTDTIENDTQIGGAIRDLKSALRGEEIRRPPPRKVVPPAAVAAAAVVTEPALAAGDAPAVDAAGTPAGAAEAVAAAALGADAPLADAPLADAPVAEAPADDPDLHDGPLPDDVEPPEADDVAALIRPASGAIGRDQAS